MAIVNYSLKSTALNVAVEMELSDTDSERNLAYLMAATPYGTVTENVQKEVPNPAWSPDQEDPLDPPEFILVQEWVTRPATPEEVLIAYGEGTMNALNQASFAWDQQRAAEAAAAAVPPITPISPPHPVPGE
jgi:hypothetical protein